MRTKKPSALLLPALAALTTVACTLPTGSLGPAHVTVSSLLSGSGAMRLTDLKAGDGEVTVPLSGDHAAFLSFHSRQAGTDSLAVNIQRSAYQVQSLEAPSADAPFEQRLRDLERKLPPREPSYQLQAATGYAEGDQERFWVIENVSDGELTETEITARARYVGEHCYVFVDEELAAGAMDERIAMIGKTFDEQIFPTNARLFGQPLASGVNGDSRITLLISPAVGSYGQDSTIGYFTLRDLYTPESAPEVPLLERSNRRLMLYISSMVVGRGQPADYLGTIAHELQHLINASQRLFRASGPARPEDLWLDEGLAMYAMEANGYGLGGSGSVVFNHVLAYQLNPGAYSLTDWRLNPEESAYGAVYLFTSYLADRFGEDLLKELVSASDRGVANVEAALAERGATFAKVFSDWTAATMLDDTGLTSDARYQYRRLNMLGRYGDRQLRGVRLSPVTLPNTGALSFKPYSAHYYYVPRGSGGTYRFSLSGEAGQAFGGLVVAP